MATITSGRAHLPVEWQPHIRFLRWRITGSLATHATTFEADVVGARVFRQASAEDRVLLEQGFKDGAGVAQTLGQLASGVIDEYSVTRTRKGVTGHLVGRDAIGLLIDTYFQKRYIRYPGAGGAPVDGVPTVTGVFMASQIAAEICAAAGLSCAWQTRDYEMWQDFDANGRCIDLLDRLVASWNVAEPNKTDILADGTLIYLRKRNPFPAAADYTYSMTSGRIQNVTLRKKQLVEIGQLDLTGRVQVPPLGPHSYNAPPGLSGQNTLTVSWFDQSRDTDPLTGGTAISPGSQTTMGGSSSYDGNGMLTGQVIEITTYRMPDALIVYSRKETYGVTAFGGIELIAETETNNTWEDSQYDDKGPINQPLPLQTETTESGFYLATGSDGSLARLWKPIQVRTVQNVWDGGRHLVNVITLVRGDVDGRLENLQCTIETLADAGPMMVWRRVEHFEWVKVIVASGDPYGDQIEINTLVEFWKLVSSDETTAAGHRPGGKNRPPTSSPVAGTPVPAFVASVVNPAPGASPAQGGGRDMSEQDLAYIKSLYEEADGLWETEIDFEAVAIPWLQKGSILSITGFTDEYGREMPLGNALLYQLVADYDPTGNHRAVTTGRAVFWSTGGMS